jgi:hypothetical protein
MLRLPPSVRPRFVTFTGPYRAGLALRSQARGARPAWVLGLVTRVPTGIMTRRGQGLPGSWASPMRACPAPGPRWNLRVWPRSRRGDAVFRCCDGVDFHGAQLSGLTHAACALLCTLRSVGYPITTQHSVPAGGQPLPGGVGDPPGRSEGFRVLLSAHLFPLPRLCLAQHNIRSYLEWRPAGTLRGFPSLLSAHLFPPPQASPGARHLLTIPRAPRADTTAASPGIVLGRLRAGTRSFATEPGPSGCSLALGA